MEKTSKRFDVLAALLCDHVRREDNGKELLIGVYSGNVVIHEPPSGSIALRCWVNMSVKGLGSVKVYFRARDHNDSLLFSVTANIELKDDEFGLGSFPLGPINYKLEEPEGYLEIDYKEGEGDWINIIKKRVLHESKE